MLPASLRRAVLWGWSLVPALPALGCAERPTTSISTPAVPAARQPAAKAPAWSEDEIEAATSRARDAGALLLVDAWAPWCHTCLSMKREVLSSPELGAYEGRVVFSAIDTDKPSSAAFMGRYAVEVWPTFFVIDPSSDRVLAVHGGSASLAELRAVIDGALELRRTGGGGAFETALLEGATAYAARKFDASSGAYLRAAAVAHPRASEAYLGAIRASFEAEDFATCADVGSRYVDAVSGAAMAADFMLYARECAKKLPEGSARSSLLERTLARLRAITADPHPSATIDDRADALSMLAEAERDGGDDGAARAATDRRVTMLDAAAAAATTPAEAAVYDYMRMRAYEDAGKPELAVAMLEQRTREMPESYEPFARLASLLSKTEPLKALPPLLKAIALSYGPRRIRYMEQEAELHHRIGGLSLEVAARRRIVRALEALPPGQADAAKLEKAKVALEVSMQAEMELPGGFPLKSRGALPPAR